MTTTTTDRGVFIPYDLIDAIGPTRLPQAWLLVVVGQIADELGTDVGDGRPWLQMSARELGERSRLTASQVRLGLDMLVDVQLLERKPSAFLPSADPQAMGSTNWVRLSERGSHLAM